MNALNRMNDAPKDPQGSRTRRCPVCGKTEEAEDGNPAAEPDDEA
jgi:hypothetical protein